MPRGGNRDKDRGSALPAILAGVAAGAAVLATALLSADKEVEGSSSGKKMKKEAVEDSDEEVDPKDNKIMDTTCPICFSHYDSQKHQAMAFDCGHTACKKCSVELDECYACRSKIHTRLRLYLN